MSKKSITTEEFLRAFQATNPFSKNRVSGAGDFEGDVEAIHRKEFQELVHRIERLRTGDGSAGLLVVGAAGVGKSHLLARLASWAEVKEGATVLFLHNVIASPERMPRYLVRASMSLLAGLRPEAYRTSALRRLLHRALWARLRLKKPPIELAADTIAAIAGEIDARGDVGSALAMFYRAAGSASSDDAAARRARDAVSWLSGGSIATRAATAIGLVEMQEDGAALEDEDLELVFRVLAHLAATAGHPLVLCVDQVDNLDDDKVRALVQFLHVLLDHARQMLVVVSGIKESMLAFREQGVIPRAAWDRIAQHTLQLSQIDEADARALLKARMASFMEAFRGVHKVNAKRTADELFPLDEPWLKAQLAQQVEFRPRDVITWAHHRWEQQQHRLDRAGKDWLTSWPGKTATISREPTVSLDQAIDEVVARKVVERINERKLRPDALPPDADNMAALTASLLEYCRDRPEYSLVGVRRCPQKSPLPAHDLLVEERRPDGSRVTTGIRFLVSENPTKVTRALERLLKDRLPVDHCILVTDEERRPVPLGPKGKEHLAALVRRGGEAFQHRALRFEAHAALDAIHGLIASARVGDLEVEYPPGSAQPVREPAAVESLHRLGTFAEQPLLRELLTEEVHQPAPLPAPSVDVKRAQETIAAHLAWRLCLTSREVTEEFIQVEKLGAAPFEDIHGQIKEIAESMHNQGFLHATAVDEMLYLQLMHKAQPAQWT